MRTDMSPGADERTPLLSVVIVSYHSKTDLAICLPSVLATNVLSEVIVVDNYSSDGTVEWLRATYPIVRVIPLTENVGFAAGTNIGLRASQGQYVLALNPDTEVRSGAIETLLRVAREHPRAFINPKLLMTDGTVNTCGNQMHYTGITTCVGLGEDSNVFTGLLHPSALSGAAILGERDSWIDIGGFDERFFLYMEDAELSLRARLRGYALLCACEAEVVHRYSLKLSADKMYYLERNRVLMLLNTYGGDTLRRLAFGLLLTEIATWTYACTKGPAYIRARARGYGWLWGHRHEMRAIRTSNQSRRQISDSQLMKSMTTALPLQQLTQSSFLRSVVEWGVRPLSDRAFARTTIDAQI